MKRIILISFCLITFSVNFYGQVEVKKDSTSMKNESLQPNYSNLLESEKSTNDTQSSNYLSVEELDRQMKALQRMYFPSEEVYEGPPTEDKPLGEKFPHTNDYRYGGYYYLGNSAFATGASTQQTYPSIGAMRSASIGLQYQPSDWFGISGAVYGAKYNAYGLHYNDFGFDASLRLKVHDRVYLRGHGRYSVNMYEHRFTGPAAMNMFPQTYYGGGVEFKINDNWGIEGGMIREFNPMRRKWENKPYLMPVFYKNGR